jgi:BASS family bile acid:Na+ symporter
MAADRFINILVTITLIQMMIGIGFGVTFAEIVRVARNSALLVRAAIANYLCVPAIAIGLLLWFRSPPMVAAGFLIVAVCPGAPYGPPFTALAKGNAAAAVGLMVILAGSSVIAAPLLLRLLLPMVAGNSPLKIDAARMVKTLLASQLLPLCAGLFVRQWRLALAERLKGPFDRLSVALNFCVFALILAVHFRMLAGIRLMAFAGMSALVIGTFACGWLLGESGSGSRKPMGFSTSVRNVAVSLVIATASFPGTPAVTAALAYGLFQTVVLALVALIWGRFEATRKPVVGAFTISPSGPDHIFEETTP